MTDWAGLTGVIGASAGLITAAGVIWDRKLRSRDATAERAHEQRLALDERIYGDRKEAYQDALTIMTEVMRDVEQTHPFFSLGKAPTGGADAERRDREETDEDRARQQELDANRLRLEAKMAIFATDDTLSLVDSFYEKARMFYWDARTWEQSRYSPGGVGARRQMDETRREARESFRALQGQMRSDLSSLPK